MPGNHSYVTYLAILERFFYIREGTAVQYGDSFGNDS